MSLSHEREEGLVKVVRENFPADVKETTVPRHSRINITVASERIVEIATFVRDRLGFDQPSGVSAVDYNREARFEIIYHLTSIKRLDQRDIVLNLKQSIPRNNPHVRSLVSIWQGVENYERESFEMFGIQFDGHPRLEKLFLNDNWEGPPPLRKEIRFPTD